MADAPEDLKTSLVARAPRASISAFDLHVLAGPDQGAHRRLGPGKVRVGTAPSCTVRLADPTVSRLHCELEVHGHGVRVTDLDSTNGTFLDGVRAYDAELGAGGTVNVGTTVLRLEPAGEPVHVELSRADRFGRFLGQNTEIRRLYAILERVAPTDSTILVQGETGTGKEALALAIHEVSERADRPFIAVDCGAIAENLIESELFGHVRGAFSGAVQDRTGLFEQAHGGTLFLDEIGELPLSLQPKLLRVLETREVRRIGSSVSKKVDVRVLAATNRMLARGVNQGTFREDLYYRLAVVEIVIPPLRVRRDDIQLLAQHFYKTFSGKSDPLPADFVATLLARAWPGNIRELRNFIERSVSLGWVNRSGGDEAAPMSVPPSLEALVPTDAPLKEARELWTARFESLYVSAVLKKTHGNVTKAAAIAGVTRRSLQRLMAQHGLRSGEPDANDTGDDD
jgi:transcriptional regulator with PAS, ATPase and Fis domain